MRYASNVSNSLYRSGECPAPPFFLLSAGPVPCHPAAIVARGPGGRIWRSCTTDLDPAPTIARGPVPRHPYCNRNSVCRLRSPHRNRSSALITAIVARGPVPRYPYCNRSAGACPPPSLIRKTGYVPSLPLQLSQARVPEIASRHLQATASYRAHC